MKERDYELDMGGFGGRKWEWKEYIISEMNREKYKA